MFQVRRSMGVPVSGGEEVGSGLERCRCALLARGACSENCPEAIPSSCERHRAPTHRGGLARRLRDSPGQPAAPGLPARTVHYCTKHSKMLIKKSRIVNTQTSNTALYQVLLTVPNCRCHTFIRLVDLHTGVATNTWALCCTMTL